MDIISDKDYTLHNYEAMLLERNLKGSGTALKPGDGIGIPFRLASIGAQNIRGQTITSYYRTFLGEQRC